MRHDPKDRAVRAVVGGALSKDWRLGNAIRILSMLGADCIEISFRQGQWVVSAWEGKRHMTSGQADQIDEAAQHAVELIQPRGEHDNGH